MFQRVFAIDLAQHTVRKEEAINVPWTLPRVVRSCERGWKSLSGRSTRAVAVAIATNFSSPDEFIPIPCFCVLFGCNR